MIVVVVPRIPIKKKKNEILSEVAIDGEVWTVRGARGGAWCVGVGEWGVKRKGKESVVCIQIQQRPKDKMCLRSWRYKEVKRKRKA